MRRRVLLAMAGALLLPRRIPAQPAKIRRIAVLDDAHRSAMADRWRELPRRLRELGHVEGTSVVFDVRSSEGGGERLQALALEVVATRPDIIVTSDSTTARAAMRATKTIPIVFAASADPVAVGLVVSLARPGGNVTGNSVVSTDAAGKRIELLRQVIPNATRLGYLGKMSNPGVVVAFEQTLGAARSLGVSMVKFDAADDAAIGSAFDAMAKARVEGLLVSAELETHRRQIPGLAARQRLPAIYGSGVFLDAGGLLTYGTERGVFERRAAEYVNRILRGARPADLPVEQLKFTLGVNLQAAKELGIKIPHSLLLRADRVIE